MADQDYKVGDVVKLASDGPAMTVESFQDNGDLFCIWFDNNNTRQGDSFPPASVVKVGTGKVRMRTMTLRSG